MIKCKCLTNQGYIDEYAYDPKEFPFDKLQSKRLKHKKHKYIELPATFDIETTTIQKADESYEGFMYTWQMCVEGMVVIGTRWSEWIRFLDQLKQAYQLCSDSKLVIYVHNLQYEFMFIYRFIDLPNVFATGPHEVLKASNDCFEFRCSYRLSNMNLAKFISNCPTAIHQKGVDDLDYRKIRTPKDFSKMTLKEKGYIYNDVKGLYEALLDKLSRDNLAKIPLTSTGYVRRDVRNAMKKDRYNRINFQRWRLTLEQYQLCRECFRGGNTASNRYWCNQILKNVESKDETSAYPYVMVSVYGYPSSMFTKTSIDSREELDYFNTHFCTIARYGFDNLRLKDDVPIPYIPTAKCRNMASDTWAYNGRVLESSYLEISLTNVDLEIIDNQYDYDHLYINYLFYAYKDYLPKPIREKVYEYFANKTTLKGVEGKEYEYMCAKAYLNSIYGMMVTDILHPNFKLDENGEWFEETVNQQEALDNYYKSWNSFLTYQQGIFVTAWSRYMLQKMIDKVGMDVVYCDTDSIKYLGNHDKDFEKYNNDLMTDNQKRGVKNSIIYNGKEVALGVFMDDGDYKYFKTLGAKKYAYDDGKHIGITVAGLSKKKGAAELEKGDGLDDFVIGKVFNDSGRTVAYFNNDPIHTIKVNGDVIETASNIAIVETTYTLGITDTMLDIINSLEDD